MGRGGREEETLSRSFSRSLRETDYERDRERERLREIGKEGELPAAAEANFGGRGSLMGEIWIWIGTF